MRAAVITRLSVLIGLTATIALAAAWASPREGEATTFNPFFGPSDFYRLSSTAPGANSDVQAQFNLFEPNSNHAPLGSINFADSDLSIADSAAIPGVGAYIGEMSSVAVMGLANEACNSQVPVTFNLVEASVDTAALPIDTPPGDGNPATSNDNLLVNDSGGFNIGETMLVYDGASGTDPLGVRADGLAINEIQVDSEQMLITAANLATNTYTVTRGWNGTVEANHADNAIIRKVNVIYPSGPAIQLLPNLAEDDGNLDNIGSVEFADFAGDQVADGAEAVPSFVRDMLDPNRDADDGGAIQARARYFGLNFVAGTRVMLFQLVVADPGALTALPNLDWATAAWGYPIITVSNDPLGPISNTAMSDLCNFSSNTRLFGVPHDNACTGASPPGPCTGIGGGFTLKLAVDGGCPATSSTNPNECGLAGQANGICPVTTCPRQTNPGTAQTLRFYQYAVSQRDYDNDGHEDILDTCHSDPNSNWDPRWFNILSGGDADGDGLPTPCDPNDVPDAAESGAQCANALDDDGDGRVNDGCPQQSGNSETAAQCFNAVDDDSDGFVNDGCPTSSFNNDEDLDGWQNRIDSCPTTADAGPGGGAGIIPNTFMWDQDVPAGQPVPDGGPHADEIAPACDVAGESCSGCPVLTPTGANGHYHATAASQTICIGAATSDCDGVADADGDGVVNARDTCTNGANPPPTFPGPNGADTLSANANAGTNSIQVVSAAGFFQGSQIVIGGPDQHETLRYITGVNGNQIQFQDDTTPPVLFEQSLTFSHSMGENVTQVMFAQSLRDLNNDGFTDISDIALLTGVFGSQGGDPANDGVGDSGVPGYQGRYDLDYNNFVDSADIARLTGIFGAACGPPP